MSDKDISRKLNKESKLRKEMLDDALESMSNYSEQIMKNEKSLQQYKIEEIKYKTTIKELNEYINIYKTNIETLEEENKKLTDEVMSLRKRVLNQKTKASSMDSILEVFIREYGIDQISAVTKIEKEQLNKFLEED